MKKNLYIVKDNLTNEFTTLPFISFNDQVAKRDIKVAFSRPEMRLQANDSILYRYGTFDTETAQFDMSLESLCNIGGLIDE